VLKKLLLTASVVCMFVVIPSVASAAALDGETLTGTGVSTQCLDNGDGTSSVGASRRGGYSGLAVGPVVGTFSRANLGATFNTATGVVTDYGQYTTIYPDDGTNPVTVNIELGSGQGVASCLDGSWTLNVTGATYVADNGDTGVVSVSATGAVGGSGAFTEVFGPRLPTSADQCKKDGWKSYGAFKNQGDCVSYVATKGKNKPAGS
jgi:hypothetical protein